MDKQFDVKRFQDDAYTYMAEFSKQIFEHELRKEDSVIQQASQMQTAFSFITAALFMVLPVAVEFKGSLSYGFIIAAFSTITATLLASLIFATIAQRRLKVESFDNIESLMNHIQEKYTDFLTEAQRQKYFASVLGKIQKGYFDNTNWRWKMLAWSLRMFYIALFLCVCWFIIALILLY